jgi:hypothetical protein
MKPGTAGYLSTLILVGVCLCLPSNLYASDFEKLFETGNQHFRAGDIQQAKDVYLSIVNEGINNYKVFYNLGNSFFKTGDIGRAVYYFRRAQKLNVRDSDIRVNLDIARRVVDETESIHTSESLYQRLIAIAGYAGAFGLSVSTVVLWLITACVFVIAKTSRNRSVRRRMIRATVISLFLCLASVFLLGILVHHTEFVTHAVAVDDPVIARNGPGDHFTGIYEQQPGYEMIVKRRQNGWVEVALPNGFTGWVPAQSIKVL